MMRDHLARAKQWALRQPYGLWWTQLRTIVQLENKRNLFARGAFWVYILAFAPAVIIGLHAAIDGPRSHRMSDDTNVLAGIFQLYYLRLGIFFGCVGIFTRLIRGEMIDRSLHYYLLAPVRREVLLLGKFVAGVGSALLLFETAVFASFLLMYGHFGAAGREYVFEGPGMAQLQAYLGITVLACLGYGAVFLLLSMLLKNPIPAAMLVMGWEAINPILPSLFQKISVASYLRHLMPVAVPADGIFALLTVVTEPVRPWLAVLGVLTVTAVVLALSCYRMRTLEISYTTD